MGFQGIWKKNQDALNFFWENLIVTIDITTRMRYSNGARCNNDNYNKKDSEGGYDYDTD